MGRNYNTILNKKKINQAEVSLELISGCDFSTHIKHIRATKLVDKEKEGIDKIQFSKREEGEKKRKGKVLEIQA